MSNTAGLGRRTVRGLAWSYGSYTAARVLVLVSTAILARLLSPSAFGVVTLALVFVSLLETVGDFGLTQGLVVLDDEEADRKADGVFAASAALGGALALLLAVGAPLAANVFREPQLRGLLPVLGIALLFRSLGATHYALAQKSIDFRSRTIAEVAEVVVRGGIGIGLALLGAGAWSLVIGYVAGAATLMVVLWMTLPWRPSRWYRAGDLEGIVRFGGNLTAVNLIAAVIANVDYGFIGRSLGPGALGLYTLGFKLPEMLVMNLSVVAGRVLFPAYAALEPSARPAAYVRSLRFTLLLCLPLSAGLAVAAGPLIAVVFGDKWTGSVTPMRVLTLYALAVTVGIPAGTAYKAAGRAGVLLRLAIPRAIAAVVGIALVVDSGIVPVAIVQSTVAGAASIIGIALASRLLSVPGRELTGAIVGPAAVAILVGLAVAGTVQAVDDPLPALVLGAAAGGLALLAGLRLFASGDLRYLWNVAVRREGPPAQDAAG